jgi:hypothetical protein
MGTLQILYTGQNNWNIKDTVHMTKYWEHYRYCTLDKIIQTLQILYTGQNKWNTTNTVHRTK